MTTTTPVNRGDNLFCHRVKYASPLVWIFLLVLIGCTAIETRTPAAPLGSEERQADASRLKLEPLRFRGFLPAEPQPDEKTLRPGLSKKYVTGYRARHLEPFSRTDDKRLVQGKPVPYLNHQFGRGDVFETFNHQLVAFRMRGMIHFTDTGEYVFQAISNDGVRFYINDVLVIDDPAQHSDRYSRRSAVDIQRKGWYPIMVEYYQRKGTAALGLFWKLPGRNDFIPVPGEAYGHLAVSD